MFKWTPRRFLKRVSPALHTLARPPKRVPKQLRLLNDTSPHRQAWADSEEAMAGFNLTLLTLKREAEAIHSAKLSCCIEQVFDDYSLVLGSFATYLETCNQGR